MAALIDTGFLLAVLDADDDLHEACVAALEAEPEPILPDVVLPELAYMVMRELGTTPLAAFLNTVADGELVIAYITAEDLARSADLIVQYADNKIDFVDCAIAALAERLNIQNILTVDRRHFGVLRPKHCDAFVLAP
ncbi:MAG: type II toxin-antitoxin system VapC family toxin [Chloroflexi bacterium]|nr:type II toxin-antitoxin system VapC family toxin [Chloroflexota bacterium]